MKRSFAGCRAVVTGASSGIGAELARQLAAAGSDLVITARREDRLRALADEIAGAHGVRVEVIACDLAAGDGAAELAARATADGALVHVLVNNAGFGLYGEFTSHSVADQRTLLALNVVALTELSRRFIEHMQLHGQPSYVLNVASTAAFQPTPRFSVYGASKAYVRNLSEALAFELRATPITVSCLCPGPTKTEFTDVAGQSVRSMGERFMQSAAEVAEVGLDALLSGQAVAVSGAFNRANAKLASLAPRAWSAWMADFAMRKSVDEGPAE